MVGEVSWDSRFVIGLLMVGRQKKLTVIRLGAANSNSH
jgi:hypothetical protein